MSEIREAFTQRMTGGSFNALDAVNRDDFPDDESYLRAATKIQLERSTPEYQRAYASLAAEYSKRQEEKQRAANEARYKELSRTVQLDSVELGNVEKKAREAAQRDLAAKRIDLSGVGAAIEKYAAQFEKEERESKIGRVMLNELIRGR
jgi:hypothetical protein